ncbi:MAG: hypothetical protein P8182_05775 [Deltaproteobacteria bacterium]
MSGAVGWEVKTRVACLIRFTAYHPMPSMKRVIVPQSSGMGRRMPRTRPLLARRWELKGSEEEEVEINSVTERADHV